MRFYNTKPSSADSITRTSYDEYHYTTITSRSVLELYVTRRNLTSVYAVRLEHDYGLPVSCPRLRSPTRDPENVVPPEVPFLPCCRVMATHKRGRRDRGLAMFEACDAHVLRSGNCCERAPSSLFGRNRECRPFCNRLKGLSAERAGQDVNITVPENPVRTSLTVPH